MIIYVPLSTVETLTIRPWKCRGGQEVGGKEGDIQGPRESMVAAGELWVGIGIQYSVFESYAVYVHEADSPRVVTSSGKDWARS